MELEAPTLGGCSRTSRNLHTKQQCSVKFSTTDSTSAAEAGTRREKLSADMVQTYKMLLTGKDLRNSETSCKSVRGRATRIAADPLNLRPQAWQAWDQEKHLSSASCWTGHPETDCDCQSMATKPTEQQWWEAPRWMEQDRIAVLTTTIEYQPANRVANPDPNWIRIQSGQWIRIRNPDSESGPGSRRAKMTHKSGSFEVLDVLFWELKASSVTWTFFMEA